MSKLGTRKGAPFGRSGCRSTSVKMRSTTYPSGAQCQYQPRRGRPRCISARPLITWPTSVLLRSVSLTDRCRDQSQLQQKQDHRVRAELTVHPSFARNRIVEGMSVFQWTPSGLSFLNTIKSLYRDLPVRSRSKAQKAQKASVLHLQPLFRRRRSR